MIPSLRGDARENLNGEKVAGVGRRSLGSVVSRCETLRVDGPAEGDDSKETKIAVVDP
ncbi:MAG TPA: hypothetical protein VK126_02700 [Nitrososphaerales archaeon]|nr:hypothetical protein [Nitrososphaerales archaeon]